MFQDNKHSPKIPRKIYFLKLGCTLGYYIYIYTIIQTICCIIRYIVWCIHCYCGSPIEYVKFAEFTIKYLEFLKWKFFSFSFNSLWQTYFWNYNFLSRLYRIISHESSHLWFFLLCIILYKYIFLFKKEKHLILVRVDSSRSRSYNDYNSLFYICVTIIIIHTKVDIN